MRVSRLTVDAWRNVLLEMLCVSNSLAHCFVLLGKHLVQIQNVLFSSQIIASVEFTLVLGEIFSMFLS